MELGTQLARMVSASNAEDFIADFGDEILLTPAGLRYLGLIPGQASQERTIPD